jgi:hypothetical protein
VVFRKGRKSAFVETRQLPFVRFRTSRLSDRIEARGGNWRDKGCYVQPKGPILVAGINYMFTTSDVQKQKLEELKAKRKLLFDWYEKNPNETRLVLEIKTIDDQIAECTRQIERDRLSRS